jgi:hypothetical protein
MPSTAREIPAYKAAKCDKTPLHGLGEISARKRRWRLRGIIVELAQFP